VHQLPPTLLGGSSFIAGGWPSSNDYSQSERTQTIVSDTQSDQLFDRLRSKIKCLIALSNGQFGIILPNLAHAAPRKSSKTFDPTGSEWGVSRTVTDPVTARSQDSTLGFDAGIELAYRPFSF
jgi:hypothetical protein